MKRSCIDKSLIATSMTNFNSLLLHGWLDNADWLELSDHNLRTVLCELNHVSCKYTIHNLLNSISQFLLNTYTFMQQAIACILVLKWILFGNFKAFGFCYNTIFFQNSHNSSKQVITLLLKQLLSYKICPNFQLLILPWSYCLHMEARCLITLFKRI